MKLGLLKLPAYIHIYIHTGEPHHKPMSETNYFHHYFNHTQCIIKRVPLFIEKQLSSLSSNEDIFKSPTP